MPLAPQPFTFLHHYPRRGWPPDGYYPGPIPRSLIPTDRDHWTASEAQVVEFLWLAREFTFDWSFELDYTVDAGDPDEQRRYYIGSGSHTSVLIPSAPHLRMSSGWGYIEDQFDEFGTVYETVYDKDGEILATYSTSRIPYLRWHSHSGDPTPYEGPAAGTLSVPFDTGISATPFGISPYRGTISDYLSEYPGQDARIIGQFSRSFLGQSFPIVLHFSSSWGSLSAAESLTNVSGSWSQSISLADSWSY